MGDGKALCQPIPLCIYRGECAGRSPVGRRQPTGRHRHRGADVEKNFVMIVQDRGTRRVFIGVTKADVDA